MKGFLFIAFVTLPFYALAQDYGFEWIDFNKSYFKISTAQDAIYRLTYTDLQNAGFPVNTVDPRRIQLFHRGEEQAILVNGQGDAVFNATDFIEFYGKKNDGTLDARLYKPVGAQPHDLYNIYSDTTAYFLTWNLTPVNGKRMLTFSENNVNNLPAEAAHGKELLILNTSEYSPGNTFSTYVNFTYFDEGEGWTGPDFQENQYVEHTFDNVIDAHQPSGDPELEVLLVGRDDLGHNIEIFAGPNPGSLRSLGSVEFNNYETYLFTATLNWSDIGPESITVRVRANGLSGGNDRISVSYIKLTYPKNFDAESQPNSFYGLEVNPGNKSYIEIANPPANARLFDITDSDNVRRIGINSESGLINAVVNNTNRPTTLLLNNSSTVTPVINRISFREIAPETAEYLIIAHALLRRPALGSTDPIAEYAEYRASSVGGGFDTLTVDIDMLYDQFNYGEVSPLAIFDFARYIYENGNPKYLFLIGKGLDPSHNFHRNTTGYISFQLLGRTLRVRDLVPSAGNPGSDICFTAGLGDTEYEPAIPTGRLPALTSEDIIHYLNKVKDMDDLPYSALWRKRVLHLSGGLSTAELNQFENYVDEFGAIAEGDFLGGKSLKITKQTNSTVELINIAEEVNNGLNLVTFFGHSAPSVTDIDIGYVSDPVLGYNNPGRYPMFLINGCQAGLFFNPNQLFGEDWILASDKGALGFIAHSSFGFPSALKRFSDTFYLTGYGDSLFINKPIGIVHQEAAKRFIESAAESPININQAQEMILLGDPAVPLFGTNQADYEINTDNVFASSFTDEPINAQSDSIALNLIVRNFGATRGDSINVRVTRTLPDNSIITYDSTFIKVMYQDTLVFSIDNQGTGSVGNNRFYIELDPHDSISELNEVNNTATFELFIQLFGTKNLYPADYGIVNSTNVSLVAQATDLFGDSRQFDFEFDTVPTFTSPFVKRHTINAKLLASVEVQLLPQSPANDSTVYFWRTKFNQPQQGESEEWATSSFTYIHDGPEGWSQKNDKQFFNNSFSGLQLSDDGNLSFIENKLPVEIRTLGSQHPEFPKTNPGDWSDSLTSIHVILDGQEYQINNGRICRRNTTNFIAFNKNTGIPYASLPLPFINPRTCGRQPQVINSFTVSELNAGSDGLVDYMDAVAEGDSVIMFTIGNAGYSSWSAAVLSKIEEIGISSVDLASLQDGEPVIIFGKKSGPAGSAEVYQTSDIPPQEAELNINKTITGIFSSGSMHSVLIGPATTWHTFTTYPNISEIPQTDNFSFSITGVSLENVETILLNNITGTETGLSGIDASAYPYLRLSFNSADEENLTSAQVYRWLVSYTPVPEGIVIPSEDFNTSEKRAEGEHYDIDLGFLNISDKLFPDSLLLQYSIFNNDSRTTDLQQRNILAPQPNDTTLFSLPITTMGKSGMNDLNIFVNPRVVPEKYYDNNIVSIDDYLDVEADDINPLLDVVFDGEHILDGDIVSPSPLISATLHEDNNYFFKTDTVGVNLFLKHPCESCTFQRIPFASENVQWFPADEENGFRVEYKPDPLEDGVYTLRIEAEDASGNISGTEPYSINFEVINESTITNFYPYPNPFSTSTRFVFTLTGSEVPEQMKIQIMTVSGKIVREITQSELGAVRIGNNITDYAWDGKDEFGDQLANGVYLYRVLIKHQGGAIKHRGTAGDKAFKKGFGKLYLLR